MKVLVACEESQTVCKAFRERGHEAYSCDIQEPSGGHQEWHILGDAMKAIEGGQIVTMDGKAHDVGKWDVQPTKRYCDSCIRKRNIKSAQASYQRRRDAGVLKKGKKRAAHPCLKKTIKPIEQCVCEAAALGLTYGQYVASGLDKE